jgi:hypothetical protein
VISLEVGPSVAGGDITRPVAWPTAAASRVAKVSIAPATSATRSTNRDRLCMPYGGGGISSDPPRNTTAASVRCAIVSRRSRARPARGRQSAERVLRGSFGGATVRWRVK